MGRTDEARANRIWFKVSLAYLGFVLVASNFIHVIPEIAYKIGSVGFLFGWYFSLGTKQIQHVKQTWQDRYQRKPWSKPLWVALGGLAGFFVAYFILGLIVVLIFCTGRFHE